jgi:hypothetical protein
MAFDPDEFLKEKKEKPAAAAPAAASSKFDPDEFLASSDTGAGSEPSMVAETAAAVETPITSGGLGAAAPAVTGAAFAAPVGITAADIGRAAQPIVQAAKETYRGPMGVVRGVADATLIGHGLPPFAGAYGAAETMAKRAQAVGSAAGEISKTLSQTPVITGPTGAQYPSGVPDYRTMQKAVPDAAGRLSEIYSKGGPNAVRAFLQTAEAAPYLNNPAFAQAAESYMSKVPGALAQAGKVAGTVARGAGRVLGPAGMAMNLYDAGQTARETQLGQRLAAGQGQRAEQAFRGGMGMNYQGPQLDAQQAQNVLQSGSPRDIQYFGGRDRLSEMIRRKAAEKVLGPVVPGSF